MEEHSTLIPDDRRLALSETTRNRVRLSLGMTVVLATFASIVIAAALRSHHFRFSSNPTSGSSTFLHDDIGDDDESSFSSSSLLFDDNNNNNNHNAQPTPLVASSKPTMCEDGTYSKHTLKLAHEMTMAALFVTPTSKTKKFETSSIIAVDDSFYAICDSSWSLYQIGFDLQPNSNVEWKDPERGEGSKLENDEESGYEGVFYEHGTFFAVRESIKHHHDKSYHAIIEELVLSSPEYDADNNNSSHSQHSSSQQLHEYTVKQACSTEFEFEGDSKGFEGAIAVRDMEDNLIVLGLCEGNHCSEKKKKKTDRGNGRLVVMRKTTMPMTSALSIDNATTASPLGPCQWSTIRVIELPKAVDFLDYSAMALKPGTDQVAITSQEDSRLWVGQLLGRTPSGRWDIDAMEFNTTKSKHSNAVGNMYNFPRDHDCAVIYCNIEGIHWIGENTLVAASDKMKSKGKQDFRCFDKDQSVHIFMLP